MPSIAIVAKIESEIEAKIKCELNALASPVSYSLRLTIRRAC